MRGVTFDVSTDRNFINIIKTISTNTSGEAEFDLLKDVKTVYVREKSAPAGLIKSNEI